MKIKFIYQDSMDLLSALGSLTKALLEYGVKLELLDGGDSYEEVEINFTENQQKLRAVYDAALALRNSGYDGPFIGQVCEPLFHAIAEVEKIEKERNKS